jgi:AmmeMemoRadiSam system protein B
MARLQLRGIRPSAIAGTWYPGSAPALRRTLDEYLDRVPAPTAQEEILGLVAPHAGYVYSGQVAAYAYRQVKGLEVDTVVVLSPIHRGYYTSAGALLTAVTAYATPLGDVPLNADLVGRLDGLIRLRALGGDDEHSLEIQLPFLQVVLGVFDLVPIMMADQSLAFCRQLAGALAELIRGSDRRVLIVASSDLSHFHGYDAAVGLDQTALAYFEARDAEGLAGALSDGDTEACGGGPIMTALLACELLGADRARILHYANSGDVTGDLSRVVGYAAGVITRSAHSLGRT